MLGLGFFDSFMLMTLVFFVTVGWVVKSVFTSDTGKHIAGSAASGFIQSFFKR